MADIKQEGPIDEPISEDQEEDVNDEANDLNEVENDEANDLNEAENDEANDLNEAENDEDNADLSEEAEEPIASSGDGIDTTPEFLKIFEGKTEFKSWDEFHTLFEEFQKETGSAFKPKSATSIEYANERRVKDIIPDHFVYQTVKMVCTHYGNPNPVKREGSTAKPRKYVARGCEAMVHLRYKGGTLNIVACNLEHKNHPLFSGTEVIRSVRSFSFTDDIDFLMAQVVMEHNPFSHWNSEKEWMALVADLQCRDERLKSVTIRVVKKRIRFLIDRYMANSNGKAPTSDDQIGILLYELAKAKQDAMDNIAKTVRKPGTGRKRGRPRKYPLPVPSEDEEEAMFDADDSANYVPEKKHRPVATPRVTSEQASVQDIAVYLRYMERKEEQDRRLKQEEIDLRRGELELHKKKMELQQEMYEFDRIERQAHLDLIKTQLEILTAFRNQQQQPQKLVLAEPKEDGSGVTEYTIVLNNDQTFTSI